MDGVVAKLTVEIMPSRSKKKKFDLIISDIRMADGTGVDLPVEIKRIDLNLKLFFF